MATEVDTSALEAQIDANKNLNKAEKKARKALVKLGLKSVPNVKAVTMKRAPSILFQIASPEVFKSPAGPNQETFVVYGVCNIDDGSQRGRSFPGSYAPPTGSTEEYDDMPPMTSSSASESGSQSGEVSSEGLQEKDIDMVMQQANVDRKRAIEALKKNGGDIVNSIMDLTM